MPVEMSGTVGLTSSLVDLTTGRVVVGKIKIVDSFWMRFWGYMGRAHLGTDEGLLLTECSSIHTFFMRFPIDVAFLDREMRVLAIHPRVKPWRALWTVLRAQHVLEVLAGRLDEVGVKVGHRMDLQKES